MAAPLEITFHGPFVFRFAKDYAWAYAPKCDEHYLNILTDSQDVRLPMDTETNQPIRTFNMTGPTSGTTTNVGHNSVITYPWYSGEDGKEGWPKTERHWHYVLRLPAPNRIYGLVPEYVWIYGYDPNNPANQNKVTEDDYARALRFRYDSSESPQFDEINKSHFDASHLGSAHPEPGYSIQIRYGHYASVVKKKEEYFLDAQSCFESMREKLPPCNLWNAFFEEKSVKCETTTARSSTFAGGPSGPHDCGAPVMAMEDGITLKPAPDSKKG